MLYWAEGSKCRNSLIFANSDRNMVVFFRRFVTESLEIDVKSISLRLNVYTNNGLSLSEIEAYWLEWLELPRSCLRKHSVDYRPTSSSGHSKKRLPFGVCSLRAGGTRAVQHVHGAIQEYGGFDEPSWLG